MTPEPLQSGMSPPHHGESRAPKTLSSHNLVEHGCAQHTGDGSCDDTRVLGCLRPAWSAWRSCTDHVTGRGNGEQAVLDYLGFR
jgi:hypothetical protein